MQIVQDFAPNFEVLHEASVVIGRTMFETDRLPAEWVRACNRMDYVWVPSEFNQRTFAQVSVAEEKLVVVPGCFDAAISGDCLPQNWGAGGQSAAEPAPSRKERRPRAVIPSEAEGSAFPACGPA